MNTLRTVKLTVSFDNNQFDIAHICNFISKLPMHGWNITFCGNEYTEANLLCNSEEMLHMYMLAAACGLSKDFQAFFADETLDTWLVFLFDFFFFEIFLFVKE